MKADLHIHTNFSYDGISSPKEMVDAAIKKGINCICITDHEETKGAIEAMKYGFDKNILVVPGIEVLSTSGDILGINIKKIIPRGLSAEKTIQEIRKQGGIAIIPHPFRPFLLGFLGGEEKLKNLQADAIESFNASNFLMFANNKAYKFAQENNLSFTAGSDAHQKKFVGRGYINFTQKITSEKNLVSAIMSKQAEVGGKNIGPLELIKNISKTDIKGLVKYLRFRRENRRKSKK